MYLNTEFSDKMRSELGYEYVIYCTGNKYDYTRKYMKGELAQCLDPFTGQIFVNEYMMVTN